MGRFYYLIMERRFLPIQNWPIEEYGDAHFTSKEFESIADTENNSSETKQSGRLSRGVKEGGNLEHRCLVKTRSSNDSIRSPPAKLPRSAKSCASLLHHTPECLHSSISFMSLPDKETGMSVDAIESDVRQTPDEITTKQSTSSHSTPIRKSCNVMDADSNNTPSPSINESLLDMQDAIKKCSRGSRSRHSLPNFVTPAAEISQNFTKYGKRKRPIKQRSMESNLNVPDWLNRRPCSSNMAVRNSPKFSGAASPSLARPVFHSSLGVPASQCRSVNSATPVTQLSQPSGTPGTSEPSSSTPMDKSDNGNSAVPSAFSNSAYLVNATLTKEGISSPASMSDGEYHRFSTASYIESGYDGEESDLEGDDDYMPSLDGSNDLPSFWLIVDVEDDRVKIYFHRRNNSSTATSAIEEHERVFQTIKENIVLACKEVNQNLLLLELHDTRMCNALLVEETEEDIWRDDLSFGIPDDHGDDDRSLLADAMTTAPGQFECECVLEKIIPLHPRLKMTVGMQGKSNVVGVVRHLMANFMVMNRKNMFVYQLSDKSVYYCRMNEDPAVTAMKSSSRRSSQLIQSATDTSAYESSSDRRMSKDSNFGDFKSTGNLILRWYGISPLSSQQEQELGRMNESVVKRLNESVLEKITVILQRNSKLSAQDVLFIQPSVSSDSINGSPITGSRLVSPHFSLSYGLPDEFSSCISAVKYYLHQNLLQFMALPRYVDSAQNSIQFVPYKTKAIDDMFRRTQPHEGSVYLFHQLIEPGKSGYAIACVALEMSDLEGNATPTYSLLKTLSPDHTNTDEIISLTEVADYQEVVSGFQSSRSGTPAMVVQAPVNPPQAVRNSVKFHLWLQGSVTVEDLHIRLKNAIRHALFDSITELLVLKPPLCEYEKGKDDVLAPMELQKSKRSQSRFSRKLSLPNHNFSSVTKSTESEQLAGPYSSTCPGKTKSHSSLARVRSSPADGSRTDAMRSLFGSLNDPSSSIGRGIFTNLIPKLEQNNREEDGKGNSGKTSILVRRLSAGAHSADEGDSGALNEIHRKFSQEWFSSMQKISCPSIFQQNLKLPARSHLKNFVQDLKKIIMNAVTECKVKIYSCPPTGQKPHDANFDTEQEINVPSRYTSYIIIARNFPLWRKAVGQSSYTESHSFATTLKFQPYDAAARPDQSPRPQEHRFITSSPYISRQQFVMITINDGTMNVWGYNISNEIANNLQSRIKTCTDFHSARWRAHDCLTFQKLGLFRHCTFEVGYPTRSNEGKGTNRFTRDIRDVDMVLANTETPMDMDTKSQQRSKSARRSFFKEAYISNMPINPLTSSSYGTNDTVVQYSKQYLEMKSHLKKKNEELQVLQRVFTNWRDRSAAAPHNALTMDTLQVLLRLARIVHHITSPILVCSYLRKRLPKCTPPVPKVDVIPDPNPREATMSKRQKRMSGSLRKSGDFSGRNIEESRSRSNSTRKGSKGSITTNLRDCIEYSRFDVNELKKAISNQYVQYWQSLQFLMVKEEGRSRSDKSSKKPSDTRQPQAKPTDEPSSSTQQGTSDKSGDVTYPLYLYRASAGGIVIVEVGFVKMNFSVKLHVIEASKLQHQLNVKQQMNVHFINEFELLKDLAHVHSFMYDFHLRYMQMYIQERQTAIKPGYHLVSFLEDFERFYKNLPDCAINSLHHGDIEVACTHVKPEELYEYLVGIQAPNLGFKTLKLVKDNEEKTEHALVSSRLVFDKTHSPSCNTEEHEAYDISYVIWLDKNEQKIPETKVVKLKFFLLFTNRRHLFPRLDRREERARSIFPFRRASANLTPRLKKEKSSVDLTTKHKTKDAIGTLIKYDPSLEKSFDTPPMFSLEPLSTSAEKNDNTVQRSHVSKDSELAEQGPTPAVKPVESSNFAASHDTESLLRQAFQSQERRRSMPNVGVIPSGKKVKTPSALVSQLRKESEKKLNLAAYEEKDSLTQRFVLCEKNRLTDYLKNICASAEIQCYKNQLWSTVYADKPTQNHSSNLPIKDFQHLLKHCQMIPLSKVDERANVLCDVQTMGIQWALSLQKHMLSKYNQICRYFTNSEETKRFLGVLNPKLYLMMFLLTVDTDAKEIGMYIVVRDRIADLEKDDLDLSSNANPNLIPLRGHLNNMVEFMCFHTWTALLS